MKTFKVNMRRIVKASRDKIKDIEKTYKYVVVCSEYGIEKGFSTYTKAFEFASHIHEANRSIFNTETGRRIF